MRFIAEICSNHNGDLGRARALIKAAKDIGCSGVKFQLFRIDELFTPDLLVHPDFDFVEGRRAWELPLDWLPDLATTCHLNGLQFGCTPFYLEAVSELHPYVDFFKVASYELLWKGLLGKILRDTDKPVFMSCGMATMKEIKSSVHSQTLANWDTSERLTLLHCISQYPLEPKNCHLAFIWRLKTEINAIAGVGYSDHSVNAGVIHRAVHRYGVETIEFHLDLDDKKGAEYVGGHCWTVGEMGVVIQQVKDGLDADGGNYDPTRETERDFRADPVDGLRPMSYMRKTLNAG